MKVVIITQDDPFYLAKNIDYLLDQLPKDIEVPACVLFDVSPFGKKESFFQKLKKTWKIFGIAFVINYGFSFIKNRFSPETKIRKVLNKRNIPIIELEKAINNPESLKIINSFEPDVLVSIAGNQIFKKPLIELAPKGCINLHTALLPKYRGLMPSFWVLKNEEEKTGVSVFFVDEGIDSGPIIVQKEVVIGDMTQKELINYTKRLGMDAIKEALVAIKEDAVKVIPNPQERMTYFSFPTKNDVKEFKKAGKKFY
ncbi:hypothetical protein GCM10027429_02350 [Marivirga atlantica]|jgi:methionyl-tRNA formyltransferase|uniref:Formyl transferase n=1 Tax=Marivirga atlantica TaxID=1548457 RepID=A0A937DD50_9BACT|nr:formyltransferase family protein [Marivirga atlantica]MBL0763847.1 formyl transferase [Marivirga atlantica]